MNRTRIDWCDMTWNPVTGCYHGCPYCYAEKIAHRFSGIGFPLMADEFNGDLIELDIPYIWSDEYHKKHRIAYPAGFKPTFHKYRIDEPTKIKKPQNIFVCSMADLFGKWAPDEWICQVFQACEKAPQHRYLFLTKNPKLYYTILKKIKVPHNFFFGSTITNSRTPFFWSDKHKIFLSIEPIQSDFLERGEIKYVNWVIIGAETGNRKGKVIPKKEWIERIVYTCLEYKIPIFMKNSLKDIWGETLIQEYPWRDGIIQ